MIRAARDSLAPAMTHFNYFREGGALMVGLPALRIEPQRAEDNGVILNVIGNMKKNANAQIKATTDGRNSVEVNVFRFWVV